MNIIMTQEWSRCQGYKYWMSSQTAVLWNKRTDEVLPLTEISRASTGTWWLRRPLTLPLSTRPIFLTMPVQIRRKDETHSNRCEIFKVLRERPPPSFRDEQLRNLLSPFGVVVRASVITTMSGELLPLAYVEMSKPDEAVKAVESLHHTRLDGHTLILGYL